jgi:hypothetical protein
VGRSSVNEVIFTALAEFPFPFSSVLELSRMICLPRSTVHRHRAPAPHAITSLHSATSSMGPPLLTVEQNKSRFGSRRRSNYCRSFRYKARASGSGTTLSPWTSRGSICSVSMI